MSRIVCFANWNVLRANQNLVVVQTIEILRLVGKTPLCLSATGIFTSFYRCSWIFFFIFWYLIKMLRYVLHRNSLHTNVCAAGVWGGGKGWRIHLYSCLLDRTYAFMEAGSISLNQPRITINVTQLNRVLFTVRCSYLSATGKGLANPIETLW